ncbi:MAG: metallophosphoesterase family protein [Chitinophagaceae bacterium]
MRTFVMGDIHGAYKALVQCFEQAGFNYKEDTLIQLGDVADGFDEVYLCIEELLKIKKLIALKGNHDDWFNEFITPGNHNRRWAQGGKATAISYLRLSGREDMIKSAGEGYYVPLASADIPVTHRRFFQQQQLYYIDESNNCFVHAGFNRHLPFKEQPAYLYYWDRSLWTEALSYAGFSRGSHLPGKFQMATSFNDIFIGHTTTLHWKKDKPMKAANIYNIDTGAGHGGRLTIMEVSSKKYWQSEPAGKLYKTSYR